VDYWAHLSDEKKLVRVDPKPAPDVSHQLLAALLSVLATRGMILLPQRNDAPLPRLLTGFGIPRSTFSDLLVVVVLEWGGGRIY